MKSIEIIWHNVLNHAGETFYTVTGLPFTYVVEDSLTIRPYREGKTRWVLSKNLFAKAIEFKDFQVKNLIIKS